MGERGNLLKQEAEFVILEDYIKAPCKHFLWMKWGKSNGDLIEELGLRDEKKRAKAVEAIAYHDGLPWYKRLFRRIFSPIEKQRALISYIHIENLINTKGCNESVLKDLAVQSSSISIFSRLRQCIKSIRLSITKRNKAWDKEIDEVKNKFNEIKNGLWRCKNKEEIEKVSKVGKELYSKACLKWHPDKNPSCKEDAARIFHPLPDLYAVFKEEVALFAQYLPVVKGQEERYKFSGGNVGKSNSGKSTDSFNSNLRNGRSNTVGVDGCQSTYDSQKQVGEKKQAALNGTQKEALQLKVKWREDEEKLNQMKKQLNQMENQLNQMENQSNQMQKHLNQIRKKMMSQLKDKPMEYIVKLVQMEEAISEGIVRMRKESIQIIEEGLANLTEKIEAYAKQKGLSISFLQEQCENSGKATRSESPLTQFSQFSSRPNSPREGSIVDFDAPNHRLK